MARIDYVDDPNAPKANGVVPSAVAIVQDDEARLLLIHKTENGKWALPGGGRDIGESITDTVVREVKEGAGCDVAVETLTGTYMAVPVHLGRWGRVLAIRPNSVEARSTVTGG